MIFDHQNSPKNFSRDGGMVGITFNIVASLIILEYLNSGIIRDQSHFIKDPLLKPYTAVTFQVFTSKVLSPIWD